MSDPEWSDEMRAAARRIFERELAKAKAQGHCVDAALTIAMDAVGLLPAQECRIRLPAPVVPIRGNLPTEGES